MADNITSIDPRFLYQQMQLDTIKEKATRDAAVNPKFKDLLNKEIEKKRLKEVSEQLESIFINMMFKSMRENTNKYRLIEENEAENIFSDMLYQEYSLQAAKSNKFGLAKMIYDQYSKYL